MNAMIFPISAAKMPSVQWLFFRMASRINRAYRRYRIRALAEPDDYAMMYEVLSRRFAHGENLPDLVVVDGGKGQLNVALSVLRDLKIKLDVIGLAKEERAVISGKGD